MVSSSRDKIKSLSELSNIVRRLKKEGKRIVHCHGVFDLVHPGHIRHIQSAKKQGDVLVVTLTADPFIKKGPGRPIFNQELRSEVLASLTDVDYVAIVNSDTAVPSIEKIKPHVFVKGPDNAFRQVEAISAKRVGEEEEAVKRHGGKLFITDDDVVFSSSHLINEYIEVYPPDTKEYLAGLRKRHTNEEIINMMAPLRKLKILIIGDAIIDQYHYTEPQGKSSKEPIVVHRYKGEESFAGGTLATANNVATLSDHVTLVTILGKKQSFESFIRKHLRASILSKFYYNPYGSTIIKRRFVDEFTRQKLFQISYMGDSVVSKRIENRILAYLRAEIQSYDLVLVNDFGHGFITRKMIRLITSKAKYIALNVQANSANYGFNVVTKYPRADLVCIDEMELRLATHDRYSDFEPLMKKIYKALSCRLILATRGPYGAMLYSKKNGITHVPSLTQKIVDRVGAGDALFAIAAPLAYAGFSDELICFIGNVAGALKIQTVGNKTPIDFTELTTFITRLLR